LDATDVPALERTVDAVAGATGGSTYSSTASARKSSSRSQGTESAFDQVVAINLKAAMFLAQAVARHQIAAGRGGKQLHLLWCVRTSVCAIAATLHTAVQRVRW
jgi:gluconate 5-dehydrogenase